MKYTSTNQMRLKTNSVRFSLTASLLLFLTFVFPSAGLAQSGVSIVPDLYSYSGSVGANATAEPIAVSGQAFTQAWHIIVSSTSANISDAGFWWKNTQPINAGDNITISFQVRKIAPLDTNNIRGIVAFEQASAPYTKSLFTFFPCNSEVWTKYIIPFKASTNYAVGEAQLTFQFAYGPQTFELGGITAINTGPTMTVNPQTGALVLPANLYQNYGAYFDAKFGGLAVVVPVTGQSFSQAIQITANGDSDQVYRAGLGWNNVTSINKDSTLLLTFRARKLEPISGGFIRAQVVFERNSGDFKKSAVVTFPNETSEWKLFQIPFKGAEDYAAGQAHLVFQFAFGPQKFEIADISLLNFGQNIQLNQLPIASYYPTRDDPNATWRTEANARISQYRKAELVVNVRDSNGHPLPGATVLVQQTKHAFKFGSAITAARLTGSGADNDIYRSRVGSHFTTAVFENDLKWGPWECTTCGSTFNQANTRAAIAWLAQQNIPARGHNLIWPSWQYMPSGSQALSADALRNRIDARFADVLGDAGINGKLYQWDVINEPYTNADVQGLINDVNGVTPANGVLGNFEMVKWFQNARRLDPKAKLYINDYDILEANGGAVQHQDYYFTVINWLLDTGAPLEGAGIQGHFGGVTPIATMQSIIDRYSSLRVPLSITEFDFNTSDEALQADFTRDFLTLIFSTPKFNDFLMWGFWENAHWMPQGAMYRSDWSSKPNALIWNDLLFREWWTNANGLSDAVGKYTVRGFKGSYNVTAVYGRANKTVTATLDANGEITIILNAAIRRPVSSRGVRPGRRVDP